MSDDLTSFKPLFVSKWKVDAFCDYLFPFCFPE